MRNLFLILFLIMITISGVGQTTQNLEITKPSPSDAQWLKVYNGFDAFDAAVAGRLSKSVAGSSDVTLTTVEARNQILELTGALTGNINLIVPTKTRKYTIYNATSGSFTLTVKTSGGSGIAVAQGTRIELYCDGTNVVAITATGTSGATTSLDNLASVNINTSLLAQSGFNLGSATKPFQDLYLYGSGTYGTNYFKFTGTPTAARTLTIPDRTATIGTTSGSLTSGNCAKFDSSGNIIDAGAACGTGSGTGSNLTAPPVLSNWTWVNQGGATAADASTIFVGALQVSGIGMMAPTSAGDNLRILKKTAPSTPYTIVMAVQPMFVGGNYFAAGFVWRQSSDGKLVTVNFGYSSNYAASVDKWNSATSYAASGNYANYPIRFITGPFWIKATDNGTNRIVSISPDGYSWIQVHSVGRTDFMTADEVGFYVNVQNATYGMVASFIHWAQS